MSRPAGPTPQYLFDIVDSLPAIVWTADPATLDFFRVSRGAELILGYPVSKWVEPHFWRDHIHPDDRNVISVFQSHDVHEYNHEIVYRMIAADGRIVWMRDRVRSCIVEDGKEAICGVMLDISAERRAYDALARSEENYRRLVDTAPDAIGVHTRGRFVYVNPKFVEIFGAHHQSQILGREVLSLVDPAYREIVRSRQAQVAIGDNVPMTREKLIRVDGSPFEAEVMAIPVVFNEARAVQVIVRDVTQRIRTDERLQLLAAGTNEAIWEGDYRSGDFWSNDRYRTLFGRAPDFTAATRKWTEAIHPEDRERVNTLVRDRAEHGVHQWSEEYRIRTVTGQYIWVLDRGRRLLDQDGKPMRVIGALLDVTSLLESEHRYRQIVEQVQDVIFTLDTNARITSLNPAFERITGFKAADWIGRPVLDLILPEYHATAREQFRRSLKTPDEPAREYKVRTASGGTIDIEGTGRPHVVNDHVIGTIGVARDVTERNLREARERGRRA